MKRKILQLHLLALLFVLLYHEISFASEKVLSQDQLENLYNQVVVTLWDKSDLDNNQPVCSIFFWKPQIMAATTIERSYILTAGHCQGKYLRLDDAWWSTFTTHLTISTDKMDYSLGSVWEFRDKPSYFKASRAPQTGEVAHTTNSVLEYGKRIKLQHLTYIGWSNNADAILFRGELPLEKGMSGSPVISESGELLGILVMGDQNDLSKYFVLPIDKFLRVFETIEW